MAHPLRQVLEPLRRRVRYDSELWRRALYAGVQYAPHLWVRYSPHFFGLAFGAVLGEQRRAVQRNLAKLKGPQPAWQQLLDVAQVFSNFAFCLTESFIMGADRGYAVRSTPAGANRDFGQSVRQNKGIILATAHTAGWDVAGPLLTELQPAEVLIVMEPERDGNARRLHDSARHRAGVRIVHAGSDPLASLPLLHHLRKKGIVALKFDRTVPGMRCRSVRFLGERWRVPEGILMLAAGTGAPSLPVCTRRLGFLHYEGGTSPPINISRKPDDAELDAAAQRLASLLECFARSFPDQWFRFTDP